MARKNKPTIPSNDAIARAWKAMDGERVFQGAEALLNTGALGPHRVDAIAQRLPEPDRSALRADLLEQAAAWERPDGEDDDSSLGIEMFAIPIHGQAEALGPVVDDSDLRAMLARAIIDKGLVHGDVAVSVLWGFWTPEDLARMDPQRLRQAAQEAADRMDAGGDAGTTPLAALAGTWDRPMGTGPKGGVLLAVLADPGLPAPGVVDPLRYMLTWGDADTIEGPLEDAVADPAAVWFDLWAEVMPSEVGTLEPSGMGMAAAVAVEAQIQEIATATDPTIPLDYDITPDDRGGAVVEAYCAGTLCAQIHVPPALFAIISAQLFTLFEPETEEERAQYADEEDDSTPYDGQDESEDAPPPKNDTPFWAAWGGQGTPNSKLLDAFHALQPPKNGRTN